MRLKRTISVDATELAPLFAQIIGSVPAVLAGLRQLEFLEGTVLHPETGERHEGLRDVGGTHPRSGTRYAMATDHESLRADGPWAAEIAAGDELPDQQRYEVRTELLERYRDQAVAEGTLDVSLFEAEVELLHDDVGQFAARLVSTGEPSFAADVRVTRPARPDSVTVDAVVPITERFVAGDLVVNAIVNVGSIPGGMVSRPQVRVDARHPRGRLDVIAKITDRPGGRWNVDVTMSARGSGWIRPFAAVGLLIGRRKIRAHLDDSLGAAVENFETELSKALAADPMPTAEEIVVEIVDGFAKHLDEARRLAAQSAAFADVSFTFTLRASRPSRYPRWVWSIAAPMLEVDGQPIVVDWTGAQAIEIEAGGSWIEPQSRSVESGGRKPVRVLVRPGDIVDYQERWWYRTPEVRVVGRSGLLDERLEG